MKNLLALTLILMAGCQPNAQLDPTPVAANIKLVSTPEGYCQTISIMFTNEGHKFMLVQSSSRDTVSVCEVTDASLVEGK